MNKVITRFPPSPTGFMHIGNIRSLLFNYLYARAKSGEIVMRFEDTDRERSTKEFAEQMLKDLETLGLDYDHGPFYQSEKTERYQAVLNDLIESGHAFLGEESNDGGGQVVRFKNPNKEVTFRDEVRGNITIDTTDFGDFVIARSLTNPLYHLTVVIDDIDGDITHVIRGEDHITSTPRQILLIEAIGGSVPIYAHLPLIVGDDKKKLGKRHGAVHLSQFVDEGYLPEALVNYLALLGWNPGDEREIFSKEELIKEFSLARIQKNPAMFSYEKLQDINRDYMQKMEQEQYLAFVKKFLPESYLAKFEPQEGLLELVAAYVLLERISTFGEVRMMAEAGEFDYLFEAPQLDEELISFKDDGVERAKGLLLEATEKIKSLDSDNWTVDSIKDALWDWSSEVGRGSILHPMRTALTGMKRSPDPFTVAALLGKEETIKRMIL